jgi:hypothetical protein
MLDWSYDLLSGPERCLLRRLGVFAAGFTLEGANAVMSDKGYAATALLEQIANLVAKSLVTLDGAVACASEIRPARGRNDIGTWKQPMRVRVSVLLDLCGTPR